MKTTCEFKDKLNNLAKIECEIKETPKGEEFTMSGEYCGGAGQCLDSIVPKNEQQERLIELWRTYHLNGMHAGTEKQDNFLKSTGFDFNDYTKKGHKSYYEYQCWVLEVNGLLYDDGYKYGTSWLHRELPENFENDLIDLITEIEEIEEEEKERPVTEDDIELFNDFDEPEKALVIALMFGLCVNEIDDIENENDNRWTVQGTDYLFGTDSEMDDEWDEELDNYLDECVYPELPESMRNYFDDEAWKSDARMDGRGHALNRYDGGEEEYNYNGTWYYAYRQ